MSVENPKQAVFTEMPGPVKNSIATWIANSWRRVRVLLTVLLRCVLHLRSWDGRFGFGRLPNWVRIPGLLMIALGDGLVSWCGSILANIGILALHSRVETISETAHLTGWGANCFRAAPEHALSVSVSALAKRTLEGHRRVTFPLV